MTPRYISHYYGRGMARPRFVRPKRFDIPDRMVWVLLAAFMVAALVTAYLTFVFVRGIFNRPLNPVVARAGAPPVAEAGPTLSPEELNSPLQSAGGPEPKPWDGASRVTILVMGLDYRDWEKGDGPPRTDTMILFSLDPTTRTAGMLSIPRDLWVNIPGFDYGKINTAYFLGEGYHVPGGGPGLAVKTVEQFLGMPINYYAQVDFSAFETFIDELGGIEVDVPETIEVDPIGKGNTVTLEPGKQLLDGAVALAYARNRDTAGSDFDRANRQQQVVMAIRDRILSMNMLKLLIQKSPILYAELSGGVHTNMTLEQIISLAWLAQQVKPENIKRGTIGPDQTTNDFSSDGLMILRPNTEEIRLLRDQIFTTEGPASPVATAVGDLKTLMKAEKAHISVLNGTTTPGLAAKTKEYLVSQGIKVTNADNAQEIYENTTIIDYTGKIYTRQYLAELLGIQPTQVYTRYDPNSQVDIAILLGSDWAANNNMP